MKNKHVFDIRNTSERSLTLMIEVLCETFTLEPHRKYELELTSLNRIDEPKETRAGFSRSAFIFKDDRIVFYPEFEMEDGSRDDFFEATLRETGSF